MKKTKDIFESDLEEFVGRDGQLKDFQRLKEKYKEEKDGAFRKTYVLDVYGIGGVGKTTLLKKMKSEVGKDMISVYMDTSGDANFIDILFKLRKELEKVWEEKRNLNIHFMLFDLLYKIFYDSYKLESSNLIWKSLLKESGMMVKDIKEEIIDDNLKSLVEDEALDKDKVLDIVSALFDGNLPENLIKILNFSNVFSKITIAKIIINFLVKISESIKENYRIKTEIKLLQENFNNSLNRLTSDYERQKYLLDIFIKAVKDLAEQQQIMFFIDNLNNNIYKSETLWDYSWLISDQGLIKSIPCFFVLGGRNSLKHLLTKIENKKIEYSKVFLNGLAYKDVEEYYRKCCGLCCGVKPTDVERRMIRAALIKSDTDILDDIDENNISEGYLPIKMRLIAEYYNQVKEEKELKSENSIITVDDLGRIDKLADLCFYFEMNIPELRRDVFHILSCINVWKEEWFQRVRVRFDNYLLNATHVLGSFSSVEIPENGKLKLHDAVREQLFKSPNNLIKYDVLEWLFLYFLSTQQVDIGENEKFMTNSSDEGIVRDLTELSTYVSICENYIESIGYINNNRFTQKEAIKKFIEALGKSLDFYNSPDTVNEQVIRMVEGVLKNSITVCPDNKDLGELRYRLGILLTHASRDFEALEKSRQAYEEELEKCKNIPQEGERKLQNFIFVKSNKNKMKNSLAYDEGSIWRYENAAKFGTSTVKEQYDLMCKAVSYMEMTKEEKVAYKYMLKFMDPYNNEIDDDAVKEFYSNSKKFKKSQYFKEYINTWIPGNSKDLFQVYTNARGNLPWFYLRIRDKNIRRQYYSDGFDPVIFGWKTYYIRKAIYGECPATFTSKHNISVYLSKTGDYEKALKISEKVLAEIIRYPANRSVQFSAENIEKKLHSLIALQLISEKEIRDSYNLYKDFLNYIGLAVEVLQYNSNFRQQIAEKYNTNTDKFKEKMKEAIERGVAAVTIRYITYSNTYHRSILNSLSFLASYYYSYGEADRGITIMEYLISLANKGIEMPEEKVQEFKLMLQDMREGIWNEERRLSGRKL